MALTLPYPDMVFVPLDILTAEEQNQLVGNIEFLANQFPVQSSNIGWSTFPYHNKVDSGNNIVGNTQQTWDSWQVTESGVYFATFSICANCSSASTIRARINQNGSTVVAAASTTKDSFTQAIASAIITANSGDTLAATYANDIPGVTSTTYSDWYFCVFRVA